MNLQGLTFARIAREESTLTILCLRNAPIAQLGVLQKRRGNLNANPALRGAIRRALDQSFALYATLGSMPLKIPPAVLSAREAPFLPPLGLSLVSYVPWGSGKIQVGLLLAITALPGSL
jgi:hypothetical protein